MRDKMPRILEAIRAAEVQYRNLYHLSKQDLEDFDEAIYELLELQKRINKEYKK